MSMSQLSYPMKNSLWLYRRASSTFRQKLLIKCGTRTQLSCTQAPCLCGSSCLESGGVHPEPCESLHPVGSLYIFEREPTYKLPQIRGGKISSMCQPCHLLTTEIQEVCCQLSSGWWHCTMFLLYRVVYKSTTNGNQLCKNMAACSLWGQAILLQRNNLEQKFTGGVYRLLTWSCLRKTNITVNVRARVCVTEKDTSELQCLWLNLQLVSLGNISLILYLNRSCLANRSLNVKQFLI